MGKEYTLVSTNYLLKKLDDGYTMFKDAELLMDEFILDVDVLTDYMDNEYQKHPEAYADPYGDGRIVAINK